MSMIRLECADCGYREGDEGCARIARGLVCIHNTMSVAEKLRQKATDGRPTITRANLFGGSKAGRGACDGCTLGPASCNRCMFGDGAETPAALYAEKHTPDELKRLESGVPTAREQEAFAMLQSAFEKQVGGSHYKSMAIQPVEYIHKNGIGFVEGAVIKYVSRWRTKNGIEDLKKARHLLDLLIEMEESA